MRIGNLEVPGMLALAPMAGVTDLAFRTVCADLGADMTITEMVSSRALVYQDKKSRGLLKKNEGSVCGAQIFGNDPAIMAEAAVMAAEISGCDFIDINMGCPMPKIAGNGDGCGLMKVPELAGDIVKAVSDKLSIPVTVKCRLGWDKGSINVLDFAKRMEDNGAAAITAASAMMAGSLPKIWAPQTEPSFFFSSPRLFLSWYTSAREETISVMVISAPRSAQTVRNARSVTPAMGASASMPGTSKLPIRIFSPPICPILAQKDGSCQINVCRERPSCRSTTTFAVLTG